MLSRSRKTRTPGVPRQVQVLFGLQVPEQQSRSALQAQFADRQHRPPVHCELDENMQSEELVHAPPSGVGAHWLFVQMPEQQSVGSVHAPDEPVQHVLCAEQRGSCPQHCDGDVQLSPGRPQQVLAEQ